MSYLDTPRLHFAGRFQADVSTVNNDPEHFDDARFRANYQEFGPGATNGWWNPPGTAAWRLGGCVIGQVEYGDGTTGADPVLGGTLTSNEESVPAKLVDLDPEQQMVSTIFGMTLTLRTADGQAIVSGRFVPAPFGDIWTRFAQGVPDSFFSAAYQSIITDLVWAGGVDSPAITQLRAAATGDALSIRFTVDGFNDGPAGTADFTWGRIVGAIGPYESGEPRHFTAARMLSPQGTECNYAPFSLDPASGRLVVDLCNSLPTTAPGGPAQNLGVLKVVTQNGADATLVLASVDTSSAALNDVQSGIVSVELAGAALEAALANPLSVIDPGGNVQLAERPDGQYVRADESVFRIYPVAPDNTETTTIYATKFGVRAPGATITAVMNNSAMQSQVVQGPIPGPPVGVPPEAITIAPPAVTGSDGTTQLTITATPPGNPRGYIDGQVYGVDYGWDGDPTTAAGNFLSLLVWSAYPVPDTPTWTDDVAPVLTQYANLYPVMRTIVDLASYHSVRARWEMVDLGLNLPIDDPNSMPVTRDLSPGRRKTILKWLESGDQPLFRTETLDDLRQLLQTAIEIEHATIPAYLYALFSIKPGANLQVAAIIRSVVVEEMLHMTLACNILNAVGGAPVIDKPGFVPTYPGELPGSVAPGLVVSLRRCSIDQIRDVFMAIEEPAATISKHAEVVGLDTSAVDIAPDGAPTGPVADVAEQLRSAYTGVEHHPFTIGWFYGEVSKLLVKLTAPGSGENIFTGDEDRQVTPEVWPKAPGRLYKVTNADSAMLAIHEIVEQGEGTSPDSPLGVGDELAHYFRFKEIVKGRQLVKRGDTWKYKGPKVPFDPDGVWPVVADPQLVAYSNPAATAQSAIFDASYTGLLALLHEVFNGSPAQLAAAVGLMFSLEVTAQKLVSIPIAEGATQTAGPMFASS